jgi:hypothetical protein
MEWDELALDWDQLCIFSENGNACLDAIKAGRFLTSHVSVFSRRVWLVSCSPCSISTLSAVYPQ